MPDKLTPRELAALRNSHWTPTAARTVLAARAASGETFTAFARRHGFLPQRLFWWRKRLAEAGADGQPWFVPAVISCTPVLPRTAPRPAQVTLRLLDVELDLTEAAAVAPEWLAALVAALRGQR